MRHIPEPASSSLPASMRQVALTAPGPSDNLRIEQVPLPSLQADEVLIRVMAAGVNRPDVLQRLGLYPAPADASLILGLEVAGVVVACGSAVSQWRPGDRLCALVNGGGYAEFARAPAAQCLPVPEEFSFVQAAALPETCFTVWHNLWQRARLQAGERLLIHGGSSGIGTMAIQIARALGVQVFVTAGSDDKCKACERLGASAINYRTEDFVARLKHETQGRGVDVILDMVGGDYVQRNIAVAATEARIVNIAFLQGSKVTIDLMPLMLKRLTLTGSTLRAQSSAAKADIARELAQCVWPLLNSQKIAPVIAAQFPLDAVARAHQLMESSRHIGKIVLDVAHE